MGIGSILQTCSSNGSKVAGEEVDWMGKHVNWAGRGVCESKGAVEPVKVLYSETRGGIRKVTMEIRTRLLVNDVNVN